MEKQIFSGTEGDGLLDEGINIRHYWQIILERRWLVIATFLVLVILTSFYLFTATPIFSSTTRLQIDRESENSLRMESFVMDGSREHDYLQTQYKNLQSRTLMHLVLDETLQNVSILNEIASGSSDLDHLIVQSGLSKSNLLQRLKLMGRAGFFGPKGYSEEKKLSLIQKENESLISGMFVFPPDSEDGKKYPTPSREGLVGIISGSVTITPIRLSRLVDVSVESPNPYEAAMIADTVVAKFLEQDNDRKREKLANAINFLKQEALNLNNAVHTNFMALHDFKLKWDIISLEETQNTTLQALLKAQSDYDSAHSRAVEAQATADEAQRVFLETSQYSTVPEVSADATIKTTQSNLAIAEAELASLSDRYLDLHPKIIEKKSAIKVLKGSLINAQKRVYDSILNKSKLAQATDRQLAGVLTIRKSEQQSMNQKSIEYNNLDRTARQSETMYNLALQRLKETELQEKDIIQNMHVIDLAAPKLGAVKPKILLTSLLGIIGGLGAGFGMAFFVHFLDDSIKSQEDIEGFLKLPFLGYIPNIKTTSIIERDMQAHLHPQSNSAEAFRTVRAAISLSPRANELHVLAVTSTVPSEGKSLVASNHAIVTAQTGAKTLLVDCDLRRPSVHKAFQVQSPLGLTSFLLGKEKSIDSIAHQTEVPNLDIICCGAVPNNPSELAGSQRMLDFVAAVRDKYEKVVFDCPPVSAVSDPLIIASCADGTVFVNKFNKIRREHARKTVQRVQDAGINIIGVCINDLDFEGKDSYYYSYYYYQNRYYASHYKSDNEGKTNQEESDIAVQPGVSRQGQSNKST